MKSMDGFTLIELIVALMVAGVLVAVAIPSYRNVVISNRLSTTANDYVAALIEARMEAIRRNAPIQFCGLSDNTAAGEVLGSSCGTASGQLETLNDDGDGTVIVRAGPAVPPTLNLTGVTALRFGGQGLAHTVNSRAPFNGLVVELDSDKISGRNRRCIYVVTGSSIVTCAIETSADTPGCPDSEPNDCQ